MREFNRTGMEGDTCSKPGLLFSFTCCERSESPWVASRCFDELTGASPASHASDEAPFVETSDFLNYDPRCFIYLLTYFICLQ